MQPEGRPNVRAIDLLVMNVYWFANSVHWGLLMAVSLASQTEKFTTNKELNLALVVAPGTIASLIAHPLAGALSDRLGSRWGRRRPFLVLWTIPNVLCIIAMAYARSTWTMSLLFLLIQISNNMANAPWGAVMADLVPPHQRGLASGWLGMMAVLGSVFGAGFLGRILDKHSPDDQYAHQLLVLYGAIALVLTLCVGASALFVKEEPKPKGPPLRLADLLELVWVNPKRYPDLFWVFICRFFVLQGIWVVYTFLQYYFEDVLHLPGEKTSADFQVALTAASVLTVLSAGYLSDRWGRKGMVYLSSGLMALVCLLFITWQSAAAIVPCAVLFGAGLGAYTSVDNALALDVLPNPEEHGKHMGVWAVAGILPQVTGCIFGGFVLSAMRHSKGHVGYTVLFVASIVCCTLGTVLIRKVRTVR